MTEDEFRALALALPGVQEGFNMGSCVFKANGKVLARMLGGGGVMLTGYTPDEVAVMVEADPATFWADDHFRNAGSLRADLSTLTADVARAMLERRFTQIAKKAVLKAWRP
jgi:hypothetical protein